MKKLNLKLLATLILAATSLNVLAQDNSYVSKRQELIKKYQNSKPLVVSFYGSNNKNLDVSLMWNKLAPYSNYLSEKLDSLVVIDVDSSYYNLNKEFLSNTDILYGTPLLYEQLKEIGWHPIVSVNQKITPTILVPNNSKIKDLNGLKDKKIMVEGGTTMSAYLIAELLDKKILLNKSELKANYIEVNIAPEALIGYLNNNVAQAIAVSDSAAKKILAEFPNKYREITTSSVAPGLVIYGNPKMDEEQIKKIKNLFLSMKLNDEVARTVLNSAEELVTNQINQFIEINDAELMNASNIFKKYRIKEINLK